MKQSNSFARRIIAFLGSARFFWLIVGLLVVQAAWIALSDRYPMAFDEDFHLGIIRLYAHHWSPFWSSQPDQADMFGAVARDPSYLYQYLMSWPHRLISFFTADQTVQVLVLRAINIGLFAGGLTLFRRLLLKTGASRVLVHLCLLLFVLIPIVPLLAAQINYDNLFLPVVALALLLTARFDAYLFKQRRFSTKTLLQLFIVCLLACLVKYAFLPLFVVIVAFVGVRLTQRYTSLSVIWRELISSWQHINGRVRWVLVISMIVAIGLCGQRYGVNLARYHTPVPDCNKVLTMEQCSHYGPWVRDYALEQAKADATHSDSPLVFTADWFYGMWLRTFFAVDGPASNFQTRGPLIVPAISAVVFAAAAAMATLICFRRRLWRYNRPVLWLFVVAIGGYVVILWLQEYQAFLRTGQAVAINGRYLLPIMPLLIVLCALSLNELLRRRLKLKLAVGAVAVICLLWGGGVLTYILRSNDAWYWPNPAVRTANHTVQRTLGPITPGYNHPTQFLGRN